MTDTQQNERFSIQQIERMVHQFYGQVQNDDLLGPIFAERIESWPPHLERMVKFWRAVLRGERTFTMSPKGAPPMLHRSIPELDYPHFERWLTLFSAVVYEIYEPDAAADVLDAASQIATAFSRHLPGNRHPFVFNHD